MVGIIKGVVSILLNMKEYSKSDAKVHKIIQQKKEQNEKIPINSGLFIVFSYLCPQNLLL
jgi:hypothetical protein